MRRKLEDLSRAVSDAVSDSSDASRQLADLRRQGFSVYLLLESGEEKGRLRTAVGRVGSGQGRVRQPAPRQLTGELPVAIERRLEAPGTSSALPDPPFLIDGRDLSFLRSVGIDPTRSPRRKKGGG